MRNALMAAVLLVGCQTPTPTPTAVAKTETTKGPEMDTFAMPANLEMDPSGLQHFTDRPGTGAQPQNGQTVSVHYTGWLTDGTKFDSSRDRGAPLEFVMGQRRVIRGWEEGIAAMKVGGIRTLVIPANLAYGSRGAGGGVIPPNATLVFKVELLEVR